MALFPLTQFDFPNCTQFDSDLREILAMYKALVKEYGTIIDALNEDHEAFEEIKNEFEALKKEVEEFETLLDEKVQSAVSTALDAYIVIIDGKLDAVNNRVDALSDQIAAFAQILNGYDYIIETKIIEKIAPLKVEIAELSRRIDEIEFELPRVYNLVRGYETDLVPLIYDVYDATRDHANTALEFDSAGLTAGEFDNLEYTAYYWDVNGHTALYPCGLAINPFTGQPEDLNSILERLAQVATGNACIMAGEFDELELTCDEFEAYQITAQQYDFNSKNILSA